MSVVKLERPTSAAMLYIADHMRQADVAEIWASNMNTPIEALRQGLKASKLTAIVTIDDTPCVMLGLTESCILTGAGVPWLLGTDLALKHRSQFMKLAPPVIAEMMTVCPYLYNYVHCDNKVSINWLSRLGFTIEDAQPYGVNGELFHKFHKGSV